MNVPVKVLIDCLNEPYHVQGDLSGNVQSIYPISETEDDSLSFCRLKDEEAMDMIKRSKAKVIVCSEELDLLEADLSNKAIIQVKNPRLTFSRLLNRYFVNRPKPAIHTTAVIDEKAKIGREVYIGPLSFIGDCEIGEGTIIEGHVYINTGTRIGKNTIIHPGVVIGTEAVSFGRNEQGKLEWFPQLGGVVIEEEVEIGANSHISRGPLPRSDTIIGTGTKIDVMVEVGHGVKIGKYCLIVGLPAICGHVKIGDYTQVSAEVCLKERVTIGNQVLFGMGSMVLNDIPDNLVVVGSPAKPIRKNVM